MTSRSLLVSIRRFGPGVLTGLSFAVPLTVYAISISPQPDGWDYGEFETVPYILGIPHATGFPAFVICGWLFSHLFAAGTVAWRLKFFSAILIAASASLVSGLARRFGAAPLAAFLAAMVFAFSKFAWTKATHADVHAMSLLCSLLVFTFVLRAAAQSRERRRDAWTTLAAATFGFGLAAHPNVVWSGIAIVPGFVAIARRDARRAATVLACAAAPLLLYAYLPIRSAVVEASHVDRAANDPIDFTGEIAWDTNRPDTPRGFLTEVTGSEFRAAQTLGAVFSVGHYADFTAKWVAAAALEFGPVPLVLAAVAILVPAVRRRPPEWTHVAVVCASLAALPFTYSYAAEVDVTRYVSASLAVALALAASAGNALPFRRLGAAAVCLLLAIPLYEEYRSNGYLIRERANPDNGNTLATVAANTPPDAIVLANWLDGTTFAYGAYVDGSFGPRTPVQFLTDRAASYELWARTHPVFVVSNFVLDSDLAASISPACLHHVLDFDGHRLLRLRCP